MGRAPRQIPSRLPLKLYAIRRHLGLTQKEMIERLKYKRKSNLYPGRVSEYELGTREPPSLVLLRYARLVEISTDVLIDDELDLPEKFSNFIKEAEALRGRRNIKDGFKMMGKILFGGRN